MSAESFANGQWAMTAGEDDGRPVIFRVRTDRPYGLIPAVYQHLISVVWKYESDNAVGMPSTADAERMTEFEDLLTGTLHKHTAAVLMAVETGTGVRAWQWYARDPDEVVDLINIALASHDPFPVEFAGDEDPTWDGHSKALAILTSLGPVEANA